MSDRIPIIVISPYSTEYGPPRTLEHVARALAASGYEPICVVPPGARVTEKLKALDPEIIAVEGLSTVPRTMDPRRMGRFLSSHMRVAEDVHRIAVAKRAAAVWSIGEATFAGGIAARRARIPCVVHVIGMSIKSPRAGASVYVRFLAQLTDTFIACSSAVAEMLEGFGVADDAIVVVHNGIPVADVEAAATDPMKLPGTGPAVGMVGAFDPRKGHELFVDAAALIGDAHLHASFFIIGGVLEGQAESIEFERRVRERIAAHGIEDLVTITGYLPTEEVYRWMAALDVVVVPSRTEAFAHALVEAMSCARPVVASALEGNLDAFADQSSGVFVRRTAVSVANAVSSLVEDPERSARIGVAAQKHAKMLFDEKVTLPALAAVVDDLLVRPSVGRADGEPGE